MKKLKIILGVILLGAITNLTAQQSINASGGEASGAGSASFSVGQVSYTAISEPGGASLIQGVQIPYEFFGSTFGSIFGNVAGLEDCQERDITLALYNEGTILNPIFVVTLDSDGEFSTPEIATGTYDVIITVAGYLSQLYSGVLIETGYTQLNIMDIIAGDLNASNGVNVVDFSIVADAFGAVDGDANYNFLADYNCDGGINIVDVSILISAFGLEGDSWPND